MHIPKPQYSSYHFNRLQSFPIHSSIIIIVVVDLKLSNITGRPMKNDGGLFYTYHLCLYILTNKTYAFSRRDAIILKYVSSSSKLVEANTIYCMVKVNADAAMHRPDPVNNKVLWTLAPAWRTSEIESSCSLMRIPLAHAAKAQAMVNP